MTAIIYSNAIAAQLHVEKHGGHVRVIGRTWLVVPDDDTDVARLTQGLTDEAHDA